MVERPSSYLTGRQQFVIYQNHRSSTKPISSGVPQGSVLGPLLFTIYMLPIGQIIMHYGFNFNCYADDIQIYFSTPSTVFPPPTLTNCIKELKLWLEANYLRFNSDKTEVILIGSKAVVSNGAFPLHGTARYGTVRFTFWGFFHWVLYLVPDTFLVPLRSRFHASRTVTKT